MPISSSTLAAIQTAGQAIDAARLELVAATQLHASRVTQAIAGNPFGAENDDLFQQWKAIARMSQTVQDMEQQFKELFHAAAALAVDEGAPRPLSRPVLAVPTPDSLAATDVVVKTPRSRKPVRAKKASRGTQRKSAPPSSPAGNPGKVYAQLLKLVDKKGFTAVNQSALAKSAGVPSGSISAALRRLIQDGLVAEGGRSQFKLLA